MKYDVFFLNYNIVNKQTTDDGNMFDSHFQTTRNPSTVNVLFHSLLLNVASKLKRFFFLYLSFAGEHRCEKMFDVNGALNTGGYHLLITQ